MTGRVLRLVVPVLAVSRPRWLSAVTAAAVLVVVAAPGSAGAAKGTGNL